jgi:hypothetical protein
MKKTMLSTFDMLSLRTANQRVGANQSKMLRSPRTHTTLKNPIDRWRECKHDDDKCNRRLQSGMVMVTCNLRIEENSNSNKLK